ncbi:hypothetical protein GCM10010412_007820 [Nonomuraea recticatena]|uniref:Transposase n=1 Tax=Nonomuraea recticatena TaxID=46178 RepID=A0ABN3R7J9_9ACTN
MISGLSEWLGGSGIPRCRTYLPLDACTITWLYRGTQWQPDPEHRAVKARAPEAGRQLSRAPAKTATKSRSTRDRSRFRDPSRDQ